MKALWSLFWQLLALRRGPEDMPRSTLLLLGIIVVNLVLGIGCDRLVAPVRWNWVGGVGSALVEVAIDVLTLWALLRFKSVSGRYVQSLTAMYAADTLLSLCAVPLVLVVAFMPGKSPVALAAFALEMLLIGWSLGVRGFIYHRSLRVGLFQGNMLSIALFLLTAVVNLRLFPELSKIS